MYAVIKSGGKQYRVEPGQSLKVEALPHVAGEQITLDQVLMVSDGNEIKVGQPLVDGAAVAATVLGSGRRDKVTIVKFRRRKHYRRQMGHRQAYTELKIDGIHI